MCVITTSMSFTKLEIIPGVIERERLQIDYESMRALPLLPKQNKKSA